MIRWMIRSACLLSMCVGLLLHVSGCSSTSTQDGQGHMSHYRPDVGDRNPDGWAPGATTPGATIQSTDVGVAHVPSESKAPVLRRGDEILVLLKDIPKEDEFSETVNDKGCIKMPLLGNVKVESKTTSDVEHMVELAYVRLGYYKKITVVIRKQDDRFYISGEVNHPGQYPISGDITLSQAIVLAADFTDFADLTEVQINRGEQAIKFNMKKIRKQQAEDPAIVADDKIYVPRGGF